MGTSAKASKKNAYDPARQWGLKPESEAPGATYVVSGHVVSSSDMRSMYIAENMGREAQAKAVRKVAAADADKVLEKLLARDKEGTKALSAARAFSKRRADEVKQEGKGKAKEKAKESGNAAATKSRPHSNMKQTGEDHEPRKSAYSAGLIRQLGFDPAAKDGKAVKHAGAQSKVC